MNDENSPRSPYEILSVSRDATLGDIRRAYRRLALDNHPDRNPGAQDSMQDINWAYEILSDTEKRRLWDQELDFRNRPLRHRDEEPTAQMDNLFTELFNARRRYRAQRDPTNLFDMFFSNFSTRRRQPIPRRNAFPQNPDFDFFSTSPFHPVHTSRYSSSNLHFTASVSSTTFGPYGQQTTHTFTRSSFPDYGRSYEACVFL
ncbi:DnaJ subfamily B member 14 [Neolecta irregularis DAH-3]|uniref:DnaJ subfamily B member 14 n=1 Tax=Neolecta irregularis (strain DAH-3) TaxID=1198029 RepID=A0A1U7LTS4_NEOID|nr:DnaJ subfamily B member 14 [Neolecta irregularis DAH-3]|eukprot:OLL26029.1 DnaJ subfamily B member 14 [Neolecta irregularis DAH-3]